VFGISGRLVLRTLDGAADLLIEELRAVPSLRSIRQLSAVAVECVVDGRLGELAACALYSTAAIPLSSGDLLRPLEELGPGTGFRVGVWDPDVRERLIAEVEHRLGWVNRPGAWDLNLTQTVDGWYAEVGPLSWTRRFGSLERLPWSTNLLVAEVLVRLAKLRPKDRVLDPFCGTGTILLAVRRREPATCVIGADHDPHAIAIARRNGVPALAQAKAERLPLPPGSIDRVITNLPFGKQVGSHHANRTLYPAVLAELSRVLTPDGRAVLLTEDKRLLRQAIDSEPNLKLVRHRLLAYNGATPTAYVLTRPRRTRDEVCRSTGSVP
jgi:tRNA G46 methylase TrmB